MTIHHLARFAALVTVAFATTAQAASFDCAKAATKRERLICATPALSDLDDKLGSLYAAKRALLSPATAALLQISERAWFDYTDTVCRFRPNAPPSPYQQFSPADCLEDAYRDRLEALHQTGKFGAYVFVRLDLYGAKPVDETVFGHEPGFIIAHVAYPQIDAANTAALQEWNQKAKRSLDAAVGDEISDVDLGYDLGLVTNRLISLRWDYYEYGHGAPHGLSSSRVWNAALGPPVRDLAPGDLFDTKEGWQTRLGNAALSFIEQHGWSPSPNNVREAENSVVRTVVDPKSWFLLEDGLEISFNSYDGGCYACTPHDGLIPWAKLSPIMAKTTLMK